MTEREYGLICFAGHRTYRVVFGGVDPRKALACTKRLGPAEKSVECGAPYRVAELLPPAHTGFLR